MKLNWNFQRRGRGSKPKNLPWGEGMDIFWSVQYIVLLVVQKGEFQSSWPPPPHPTPCMVPRSHLKLRIQCVVNYKMSVLHWGAKPRTGRWLLSFTGIYNMVVLCFFGLDMYPLSQLLTQLWLRYEESITNIITWKMKILKTYYWCKLRVVPENIHPPPTVRIFFTFETPLPPWNFQ